MNRIYLPWSGYSFSEELTKEANESTRLLFKAIEKDDIDLLKLALQKPDTNINMQTLNGETALLCSLVAHPSSDFIMHLVQAGCDVTIPTNDKSTPLHMAIRRPSVDIACELIKRGADVNAQDELDGIIVFGIECVKNTPLHYAISDNYLEAVCMLLYYGADVNINNSDEWDPLKLAVNEGFVDAVEVLINYYDELYFKQAVECDFEKYSGLYLLYTSLHCQENALSIFMLLWPRVNFLFDNLSLNKLLINFLSIEHYVECYILQKGLRLILEFFISNCYKNDYIHYYIFIRLFNELITFFYKCGIEPSDRLNIIYMCLSLGAPVTSNNYQIAYQFYGFGDVLEAFIYSNNDLKLPRNLCTINTFILPLLADPNKELFYNLLIKEIMPLIDEYKWPLNYFLNLLGFYSLPVEVKQEIKKDCQYLLQNSGLQIFEKLDRIPEFPSLFELCRNQIRKSIKGSSHVKYSYQFHDGVKKLNIPPKIQDIIRFGTPIYF